MHVSRFSRAVPLVPALALAACVADPAAPPPPTDMPASPLGPPFIETLDPTVTDTQVAACRNVLDAQTDGAVRVVGSEFSQANSAVYLRVGDTGAPWRCLVSSDGAVVELLFARGEGAA